MYFLGLITRCKDEFFIKEFCDYYISQGVDKIFVIDDNSINKSIYSNINEERIIIIYKKNIIKNNEINKLYKLIRFKFKWLIYCDVDEFIVTKKNINHTIRYELSTIFKDADCIKVPWVMMSCNNNKHNPKSILIGNTYRWNHNKKHFNKIHKFRCRYDEIEIKSIFKPEKFNIINDHHPNNPIGKCIIKDSIKNQNQKLNPFYKNLREIDIKDGIFLCYHFRIISQENSIDKIKNNIWYKKNNYKLIDIMNSDYSEIKDETLKYKKINNMLKYVHITKTSGTYIEKMALEKNLYWGKNDPYLKKLKLPKNSNLSFWHLPLKYFLKYPYKNNTKLFTIVRNPYNRILSECMCKYGNKYSNQINNKQDLNNYIKQQVSKAYDISFHHFLPQHLYTHDSNGKKIIDYIIKYEEINKFNDLMAKYKIDIKYKKAIEKNKKFTIKDISKDNIILINKIYNLDFKYYKYILIN